MRVGSREVRTVEMVVEGLVSGSGIPTKDHVGVVGVVAMGVP
ncbi:MAG: hypothetical protein N0A24_11190 [Armatimonadetes bacterium]|nr:hypothetical protein [Armatimonadota bacterium]MDW8154741.1 hypothetical protein [Armatimonadota bacterium]